MQPTLRQLRHVQPICYRLLIVLVVVLATVLAPAPAARAASFTVNTTADTPDANPGNGVCADSLGRCSLRAAIEETNALAGTDAVQVPANTYLLNDQLRIEDSLNLNGAGAASTILDGQGTSEVLQARTVELLICDNGNDSVASYDRNGQPNVDFLGAGASGMDLPGAIEEGPSRDMFVAAYSSGVHRFDLDGRPKGLFLDPAARTPRTAPTDLVYANGGILLTDYFPGNRILRVDLTTSAVTQFVAPGAGGLEQPNSMAYFGGDLYVTSVGSNQVLRYDGMTGAFEGVFVDTFPSGLDRPRGLVFRSGSLYVASENDDAIFRYNATTGAFIGAFVASGSGGLDRPSDIEFGPDGDLYVISGGTNRAVLRYNGTTGAFKNTFVTGGTPTLGNPSCLHWRTAAGSGPTVNISGLTLQNGQTQDTGGPTSGLDVDDGAYVALRDGRVRNNRSSVFGGGIQNWGTVELTNVEVTDNRLPEGGGGQTSQGGGIFNAGVLRVRNSLIAANFATRGGGISNVNQGRVEVVNSTISGNRAIGAGGGIRNVVAGIVNISFSTITANRANESVPGGGGSEANRFGGGVFNGTAEGSNTPRINMANTILAGNTDNRSSFQEGYSPDCYSPGTFQFTSHRDNIVGILTTNCSLRDTTWGDTRFDTVGTSAAPLDPRLFSLSNNGGATRTHALRSDSPAINADDSVTSADFFDCPATDQRGLARPTGPRCDVGAYEVGTVTSPGPSPSASPAPSPSASPAPSPSATPAPSPGPSPSPSPGPAPSPGVSLSVTAGTSGTLSALPTVPGAAGVRADLFNNTAGSPVLSLTVTSLTSNPTGVNLGSASGHYIQFNTTGGDTSDTFDVTLYYPSSVQPVSETNEAFVLVYFNGSSWLPVQGSGGATPQKNTTDNADGTISGGSFTVTFDSASLPKGTDLSSVVFAFANQGTPQPGGVALPLVLR